MNQKEPEQITDKCDDDALKHHGKQYKYVYVMDRCFPKKGARNEEDRNGKDGLVKEGVVVRDPADEM
jgi:hypothetical protein